ncbi:uncharacterized protein DNG_06844 [Cephalotrichum gorgonifer]|uniref:SGNH hydrolase-type esterase domain-containing protein n=1 Tax=Cephalotrichum gorgonifer TaxID=2041049 RepID=A0AAE8N0E9_9PEZI|nr:uncharacterized protein DNG_06844 [Cephalotrichum gorgonifer]
MAFTSTLLAALWLQVSLSAGIALTPPERWRRDLSTPLRIMPLGDSITRGSLSTNLNGYRGYLQTKLDGAPFDFIGTLADGSMTDRSHEGHSGKVLNDIQTPDRLETLVGRLFEHCPDSTVLVAQIIGANDTELQGSIDAYNSEVAARIGSRTTSGEHVALVDMSRILDLATDFADTKHPNDLVYAKMAAAWYEGIQQADLKGWIRDPVEPEVACGVGLNDSDCAEDS